MRNTKVLFLLFFFGYFQSCKQENKNLNQNIKSPKIENADKNIPILKEFYNAYFTEMESTNKNSEEKLDLLQKKYMTSELYKKIKNLDLDYDPIINGQDIDENWRKTLTIKYNSKDQLYQMCTTSSFDKKNNCTYLRMIGNRISDIKVNDIESILNFSSTENISVKNASSNLSQWYGNYTTSYSPKNSEEPRDSESIELDIKNDSIIFHVDRYFGAYSYLLKMTSENQTEIKLNFDKLLDGDKTDALEKIKDFGTISYKNSKYTWNSPYLNTLYKVNKTFILDKNL